MNLPAKPKFASPCNNCGACCIAQLCPAGQIAFPDAVAPCPGLLIEGGKALCKLVLTEKAAGMEPLLALNLGIGYGCQLHDDETTDAELVAFDDASQRRSAIDWTALRNFRVRKVAS